jgi:hypothetical protein
MNLRIVGNTPSDLENIVKDIKDYFKNVKKDFNSSFSTEKRKFIENGKIIEKNIDTIKTKDNVNGKETSIKLIPMVNPAEMKVELGGENETVIRGKIKNQLKSRGNIKSYTKDAKKPMNETSLMSIVKNIIDK